MLLNIIMFIVGAACGFVFAVWTETEDEDDLKNEYYIEEDYPYDEDEEI